MDPGKKIAIIIGAGPAGLTAAYEILHKTDVKPIVYEMTEYIGGISKTLNYKGNRIDIGGHRFFSKSNRVMKWWQNILPIQGVPSKDDILLGREIPLSKDVSAPNPEQSDEVMLVRSRLSRIFFMGKFFDYPISLSIDTVLNLGLQRTAKVIISYIKSRLFPIKVEKSLEDFFINRFGKELYLIFFKDYTEKVWGIPCHDIRPEWGYQRVKGLSVSKVILQAVKNILIKDASITQKRVETSLIEQFLYPKFGPGQMWEKVAGIVREKGGEVLLKHRVIGLKSQNHRLTEVKVKDESTGEVLTRKGDYFFSTMPVKDLIKCLGSVVPEDVQRIATGLTYRDFITIGLLLNKLKIKNNTKLKTINNMVPDNWIYVQERDVKLGRIQIFNNWSPYMVKNGERIWVGLEYFCNEDGKLWNKPDKEIASLGINELVKIGIIDRDEVLDSFVYRMPKAYPCYFGSYDHFYKIRNYTDKFENLFLIGRNGMHRYNNQDHSMLSAMVAVNNMYTKSKDSIWAINAENDYMEEK